MKIPEAKQQELVAKVKRLGLVTGRKIDRDVFSQPELAHLFRKAAALKRAVLEEPSGGDKLGAEDVVGRWGVLLFRRRFAPEDREAFRVPVVQDLHDLCALVAEAEVTFVYN